MIGFRFISLVTVAMVACSIQPPEPEPAVLPEITMEGLNTFGCTVAGEVYEARIGRGFDPAVEATIGGDVLFFETWDRLIDEKVYINVRFSTDIWDQPPGKYYIRDTPIGIHPKEILVIDPSLHVDGLIVPTDSAYLEIIYIDEASRIISGTFQFDAETVDGDTIQIRKGRFDVTAG